MKRNIALPFTNKSGGNNNSFQILNENEINIKKTTIVNFVKKMIFPNNLNNSNKINYIKASDTKEYYNKINKK